MNKIECAQDRYCDDIELDDNPATSVAETGIWVQAWVFVRNEDIEEEMKSALAPCLRP